MYVIFSHWVRQLLFCPFITIYLYVHITNNNIVKCNIITATAILLLHKEKFKRIKHPSGTNLGGDMEDTRDMEEIRDTGNMKDTEDKKDTGDMEPET